MIVDELSTPADRLKNLEQLMPGMHRMLYGLCELLADRVNDATKAPQFFDEADYLIRTFAQHMPELYDAAIARELPCYLEQLATLAYSEAFANGVLERSEDFISGR